MESALWQIGCACVIVGIVQILRIVGTLVVLGVATVLSGEEPTPTVSDKSKQCNSLYDVRDEW